MWQKLRNFIKNDPVVFVLLICVIIVGGIFANIQAFHLSSEPEFCGKCHPNQSVGPLSEYHTWDNNIHATAEVECLDCHGDPGFVGYFKAKLGGVKDLYGEFFKSYEHKMEVLHEGATNKEYAAKLVPNERCLFCHSDDVNKKTRKTTMMSVGVKFRTMDQVKNPEFRQSFGKPDILTEDVKIGVVPNHKKHIEEVGLNCVDCHLGVAHGGKFRNTPKMETCFECHAEKRAENKMISAPKEDDCAACHVMQKSLQEGNFVKDIEGDRWYMADLSCTECHADAYAKPNTDTCVTCHEDESYASVMVDTQKAYEENFVKLEEKYKELFKERLEMSAGKRALFNKFQDMYKILLKDGSKGIHNPEYFDMIFEKANELYEQVENYVEPKKESKTKVAHGEEVAKEKHAVPAKEEKKFEGNPAELVEIAPESINLAEQHGIKTTKSAVIFDHKGHFERMPCESCHSNPEEGALKVQITKLKGTNNSFHKELCFPCHKKEKVKKGTSCSTCHKK
jgi:nitrate/TMAO reductase-like tetraheme cytochrome c subunit